MVTHSYFGKRPRLAIAAVAAALACLGAASLPIAAVTAPEPPPVRTTASATLAAVGDVLMHGAVKDAAADHRTDANDEGFGWLYAPIVDLLAQADLTFANLETPIAPRSGQTGRPFVFNAPPAALRALRTAGVDVVSVANNHVFDQGRAGFLETLEHAARIGVAPVGAGEAPHEAGPRVFEAGGLRIAIFAWAHFFNGEGNECPPHEPRCVKAAQLDGPRAVDLVRAAAARHDAVIVSVHWGNEYEASPRPADVELARDLCEAGALAVIGHHPHVLQPIEIYRRADGRAAVIAYSLGNFISNQSRHYVHGVTPPEVAATRDGALLRVTLARRDYGRGVEQVELAGVSYLPLWTENDAAEPARRTRARPRIRVVSLDRALAAVRAELAALPDPLPAADRERFLALRRREELYVARRKAIAAVLGEDLIAVAPPPPATPAAAATSR
jgi:poly-gamma-glutamate synthesis protein (capsule biosynthesis protein)